MVGTQLRLGIGLGKAAAHPHNLTGRAHLWPQQRVNSRELGERQYHLFHRVVGRDDLFGKALFLQRLTGHHAGGNLGQRGTGRLGDERHGTGGARVHFDEIDFIALDRKLHVHQADNAELQRQLAHLLADLVLNLLGQGIGRQGATRVTGVDTGLLDVLHDAADDYIGAVADGIHVQLGRIVQEAVQQHRRFVGDAHRLGEVATQILLVIDDFHGAATQHVGGANHQRVGNALGQQHGLFQRGDGAVFRLLETEALDGRLEALAVFGAVDGIRAGTDDRHAVGLQRSGQFQRGLATVLDNHALGFFDAHDFQHIFQGHRLEVETIRGVVIGRDGLRVTVDHDGLVTIFAQGQRCVHAAVVELDTLTDTVRAAADDHDLVAVARSRFALLVIAGVHVGGVGGELGGAGIYPLVDREDVVAGAQFAHFPFGHTEDLGQTGIGKAFALEGAQEVGIQTGHAALFHLFLQLHQIFNLYQEPGVNLGQLEDTIHGETGAECIGDIEDTVATCILQLVTDAGQGVRGIEVNHGVEAGFAGFEAAQRLVQGLLEVAADGHHFADRLHLGRQTVVGTGEFFEVEARHLGDHVVDGRLEGGRSATAGDVVHQLVEGVTDGELGSDLGDGETGRLGGQRGGARHPRVHLDDDHATIFRVDTELDVGAAGLDADFAQHRHGGVAHQLVLLVGQRLGWRDRDGVTGVDTHGVEVFDGADDDAVVVAIPHHFHLVLFPADQRLVDEQLFGRRQVQTTLADLDELFGVVGDAATRAAHGKGGTDDAGEADHLLHAPRLFHVVGDASTRALEANAAHRLVKTGAVFGLVDGVGGGTDHLDTELGQHAMLLQRQCAVERSLAAHGGQDGVRALFLDDFAHHFPGDGLDVGGVCHLRVGHDGGRVGVDQNDAVALLAQGFARLGAGVVKFAGLADDDGAGAEDQDALKVITFWHETLSSIS